MSVITIETRQSKETVRQPEPQYKEVLTKIEEVNLNFEKLQKNIINKLMLMSQAEIIADGLHLTK